jgi:hypothetical protein
MRQDPEFGPGPWHAEPVGTVAALPEIVEGRLGPIQTYWMLFDAPQHDVDGYGPYERS